MTAAVRRKAIWADEGFTLLEVLLVVAIVGTVASIAVPGLFKARAAANEASAIGTGRSIVEAQAAFSAVCGRGGYAEAMDQLAAEGYVPPDLVPTDGDETVKSGYSHLLTFSDFSNPGPTDCMGRTTTSDYYWSAVPTTPNLGTRSFATTAEGAIWQDTTGVEIVEPVGSGEEVPIQ